MKTIPLVMCFCVLTTAVTAWAAPSATIVPPGPGIDAPFLDSVDVDTYGLIHSGEVSGWEFDGTGGTATGMSWIRYRPTRAGEAIYRDMPVDED